VNALPHILQHFSPALHHLTDALDNQLIQLGISMLATWLTGG
jgi:hypothetical protein